MNKKAKKITSIVVSCLTGLIVLMVIYMLACNVIAMQRERPVQIFGYSYSYVPTESMEPTIKKGDSVIFKDISYSSCEVGDIIVYKSKTGETKGLYILHRIIEITDDGFITQGDNNDVPDSEIITKDMFIGRYVKTFNFLNIGKLANNKNIIYTILIIFFLSIMVMETVNLFVTKYKKKLKEENNSKTQDKIREELLDEMREELRKELENEGLNKKNDNTDKE